MTEQEQEQAYRAMLRAIMLRHGGSLCVAPEEMPDAPYTIMWRSTENGGLEAKLQDGGKAQ